MTLSDAIKQRDKIEQVINNSIDSPTLTKEDVHSMTHTVLLLEILIAIKEMRPVR